jgi:hypothetical protein
MSGIMVFSKIITVIPVTDTNIYASGDQIGTGPSEAVNAMRTQSGLGCLESITVIDKAKQASALDLLFFDDLPTFGGSNNAAFTITDAEAQDKLLGVVNVPAADYKDIGANSVASIVGIGFTLRNKKAAATRPDTKSIWLGIISRGTPTYSGASDLIIKLGIFQH